MIDGLAVVDKPAGMTSHDVVDRCRRTFGQRRVGHSGTLDPDATGVLLIGLGRVTRLLRFLTDLPKEYTGEVVLGTATSTLDASGEVVGEWDMSSVTSDDVRRAAGRFVGDIEQVPPMVSAVRVGGRRLHEIAREGGDVQRKPRHVTVHRLEVADTDDPLVYRLDVSCSSGTYIRSLAADLGEALGGGAHLRNLRRTAIGSFSEEDAVDLGELSTDSILAAAQAVRDYEAVLVDAEVAIAVGHGKVLADATLGVDGPGPWAVLGPGSELLAVYERAGADRVKPAVVIAAAA